MLAGPTGWPSKLGRPGRASTCLPGHRDGHEVVPDRARGSCRRRPAGTPSTFSQRDLALRVAHPHAGHELRGVAAEPRVEFSCAVPVLPATGRPTAAAVPVPPHHVLRGVGDQVGVVRGRGPGRPAADVVDRRLPSGGDLGRTASARCSTPLRRRAWRTRSVISSGLTACVPSVIEHTALEVDRMPSRCAMSTTLSGPTAEHDLGEDGVHRVRGGLQERERAASAVARVDGCHGLAVAVAAARVVDRDRGRARPVRVQAIALLHRRREGERLEGRARLPAAAVAGSWRGSTGLVKSFRPTIARTSPVVGSIATSARRGFCSVLGQVLAHRLLGRLLQPRSSVVVTRSPPP